MWSDQLVARRMFEMDLNDSPRYEVVHMVASAAFADTFVLKGGVDLVLLDILMHDGSNGLDAASTNKKELSGCEDRCCHLHAGGLLD